MLFGPQKTAYRQYILGNTGSRIVVTWSVNLLSAVSRLIGDRLQLQIHVEADNATEEECPAVQTVFSISQMTSQNAGPPNTFSNALRPPRALTLSAVPLLSFQIASSVPGLCRRAP